MSCRLESRSALLDQLKSRRENHIRSFDGRRKRVGARIERLYAARDHESSGDLPCSNRERCGCLDGVVADYLIQSAADESFESDLDDGDPVIHDVTDLASVQRERTHGHGKSDVIGNIQS